MMRRGFSLVELILAIFILGIGMISVAALFPAGIIQQQYAEDDVYGPIVAKHALSVLRTRLGQDDFGTFEEFTPVGSSQIARDPVPLNRTGSRTGPATVSGDWSWKRPGLCVDDNPATIGTDEAGMYDIFSLLHTGQVGGRKLATPLAASTFGRQLSDVPTGVSYASSVTDRLFGIPYNRAKYDQKRDTRETNHVWTFGSRPAATVGAFTGSPPRIGDATNPNNGPTEPGIFFTQRERYWPQPAEGMGRVDPPRYVWDCMFRRLNGKVQVAIFVYRVAKLNSAPNSAGTPYVTAPLDARADAEFGARMSDRPPIPHWVSSRAGSLANLRRAEGDGAGNPWGAGGLDAKPAAGGTSINASKYGPGLDDTGVPGTGPVASATDDSGLLGLGYSDQWQSGGQWLVDFYGNVHHVVSGRNTIGDGPVFLARPVPLQPFSESLFDADNSNVGSGVAGGILALPGSGGDAPSGIQDIWFIPRWDANENDLVPVYAVVEEL